MTGPRLRREVLRSQMRSGGIIGPGGRRMS